ncbi:MAG: FAD-dependent oxidoreductase [Deltaproteobacteria bacterium]|nr:FAD-dependent oxidoreductase [Deltaproteobacteria bacterium]MBW2138093.1 FAD-dependent oxidoreductase [Deltaproteobacteria bacterium]
MSVYPQNEYKNAMEWPYPVNYGKENEIEADLLIIGGGIAGCHAAINAAKRGAKVAVVDKAPIVRSGSGGAGVDHWHGAVTNPCSRITPEEMMEFIKGYSHGVTSEYGNGIAFYILCKESYDALLDVEKMGVKVRDVDDEFVGAEFRDEKTKLMFAYDYENKHCIRVQGANVKPCLYRELKKLGVSMYERIMVTSLLNEGGKQGARVVGATGVNMRTGEFYVFKSKATILATAQPTGLWIFSTELQGNAAKFSDPNCSGDGHAIAWEAGAEFTLMEGSIPDPGGFRYPPYGTGNAHNTWFACNIVDAKGKEVPWVDRDGRILKRLSERYRPAPEQKFFVLNPPPGTPPEFQGPRIIPDLPGRIKKGEFSLPLYADLPSMPEHERRAIFGLMVGNEGKTRIPIYMNYTSAGFDPDKDMLQATVLPPDRYSTWGPWWLSMGPPQWREAGFVSCGGVVFDWDLRTTLEGLYAAGTVLAGGANHATAATTGRYAGRKAASYVSQAPDPLVDREQVAQEKERVYLPVRRKGGIGWKELQAGICRIMQDYCGEYKSEEVLKTGLWWLNSIRESEAANVYARNPHELARALEVFSRLTVSEMIIHASLARRASGAILDFKRVDYPELDPPEWNKFVTIRREEGQVKIGEIPFYYWLLPPNASSYEENYTKHTGLQEEVS